jgi:phage terminase small subunit
MTDEVKPLSKKQEVFISEYLKCFNGSEAARRAGYSAKSARQTASDLLATPYISEQIKTRLAEVHMSADEALKLLADIARGDIGEYIDDRLMIDLSAAREKGATKIIKKIRQRTITKIGKGEKDDDTEITDTEIELYSAKDAIDTILKAGGKLKDTELTINVRLTDD